MLAGERRRSNKREVYVFALSLSLRRAETEKGLSRKHIIEGLRASLERLQLEYVDIVFANKPDSSVPMEGGLASRQREIETKRSSMHLLFAEIVRAFTQVINNDLCFYWGTSRWSPMEIMVLQAATRSANVYTRLFRDCRKRIPLLGNST